MAITYPSIFLTFLLSTSLLLSLFFSSEKAYAYGGDMTETHHFHRHVIGINSLLPTTVCSTSTTTTTKGPNNRPLLKIVHRQGPCLRSRLGRDREKTKSPDEILKQTLLQDRIRVDSLQFMLSNDSRGVVQVQKAFATLPARSGSTLGTNNYVVSVGFGTPKRDLLVVFDTGSDLTWIQCAPCSSCYQQKDPIFDSTKSKTFSNVTCNSPDCYQLKSVTSVCSSTSTCNYGIQYGDQSFSVGFFARETLTLTPTDVFPNFLFGCGQTNRGLFGRTAGYLGLGRNKLSLVSQSTKKYGNIFSYCLPSTPSSTGYLTFGDRSGNLKHSSSVKFTPLIKDSRGPSFYFLDLMAISVGGSKLPVSSSVFASSGTIIDSGIVITRLPPLAYSTLRSTFRTFLSSYPLAKPSSILDTCYDLTNYDDVTIPAIALFFRGNVVVDIDPYGILIAGSKSQVCLAFAANDDAKDVAILGNNQQKNLEVIYDVAKGRLGFSPSSCN